MSITDATTSINTAWQEQATVTFTSGTLASITEMVLEVEAKLKRGTLGASSTPTSTQVQTWLIRAKQELSEIKKFTFKRRFAYCATVAAQYIYSLPPDYNGGDLVLRDVTNDRRIPIWDSAWFDTKYPDPSAETSDEPLVACIKNMELWIVPPAGGVYQLELEYGRSGADNTATDFSWLPEIERFRCCDFAISEAFESLHMYENSTYFKTKWASGLAKAIKADAKRRWKSVNFSATSVFDHHAAINNQPGNNV